MAHVQHSAEPAVNVLGSAYEDENDADSVVAPSDISFFSDMYAGDDIPDNESIDGEPEEVGSFW